MGVLSNCHDLWRYTSIYSIGWNWSVNEECNYLHSTDTLMMSSTLSGFCSEVSWSWSLPLGWLTLFLSTLIPLFFFAFSLENPIKIFHKLYPDLRFLSRIFFSACRNWRTLQQKLLPASWRGTIRTAPRESLVAGNQSKHIRCHCLHILTSDYTILPSRVLFVSKPGMYVKTAQSQDQILPAT